MGNLKSWGLLTANSKISAKKFVAVVSLASGTLAWFFLVSNYFNKLLGGLTNSSFLTNLAVALFFGFGAFSAIIGTLISKRVNTRILMLFWIILGLVVTFSLSAFSGTYFALFSSILLGFSLGLGLPCCFSLIAESTVVEERASVSGVIILGTFIIAFSGLIIISVVDIGLIGIILVCGAVRAVSLAGLALDPCEKEMGKNKSWLSIISQRQFAYYLLPWVLFNVAAGLATWIINPFSFDAEYSMAFSVGTYLRFILAAVFGIISGFAADRFGRKQPIIIGLVMLGISFALLGTGVTSASLLVYLAVSGSAWGSFLVIYLAVPGDLAFVGSKEKSYTFGAIAPLLIFMSLSTTPELLSISVPASTLSPILSIILFLSVIPIFRAAETLPENKIRSRELREYLGRAGKHFKKLKSSE